jgi:hypothetical protein
MIRKSLIALAAAGTLALGMTSMANTASAKIVISIGGGYYQGWHHGWHHGPRCFWKTKKVWHHHHWVWKNVRICPIYY